MHARGSFQGFLPGQDYLLVWEQIVGIPVPQDCGGLGGDGGLQGFSPGQGAAAYCGAEFVDIPVPGSGEGGGSRGSLLGFPPGQNSTADVEQNVDFPARGGLHGFLLGQSSSSSSRLLVNADEGIQGGFRTFSRPGKSARLGPHSGSELSADFTPSTPAAYVDSTGPPMWVDDAGLTWWQSASGRWYLARDLLFGGTLLGDVVAAAGGGVCGAVLGLVGRRPGCAGRPADRWKWSFPPAVRRQVRRPWRCAGGGGRGWRQALLARV